jgi:hypothetical protein
MNRETLEAKDPTARFGGVYVEMYRGHKIRIQRGIEWGTMRVSIAGEPMGLPFGYTNGDVLREARYARGYIDDSHKRPDAYTWSRAA